MVFPKSVVTVEEYLCLQTGTRSIILCPVFAQAAEKWSAYQSIVVLSIVSWSYFQGQTWLNIGSSWAQWRILKLIIYTIG